MNRKLVICVYDCFEIFVRVETMNFSWSSFNFTVKIEFIYPLIVRNYNFFYFILGKYLSLAVLCFTSILVPSITSGLLYAIFLCCVTYWACYKDLGRGFVLLCQFISVILFFYVIAIFCYQTEWIQEFLHPDWRIPRLVKSYDIAEKYLILSLLLIFQDP